MARSSAKTKNNKVKQQDFFVRETFKKENECWSTNLFHEVFLRNDMQKYFKEFSYTNENNDYDKFLNDLKNIVSSLNGVTVSGEHNTVNNVIVPLMGALGWIEVDPTNPTVNKNYGTQLNIRNEEGEKGELDLYITEDYHDQLYIEEVRKKNLDAFHRAKEKVIFSVEAKKWGELQAYKVGKEFELSENELTEIRGSALTPPQQACKYMQMMDFDYTILTDGNTWQLLNKNESLENAKRAYEFDFGKIKSFIDQLFEDEDSAMVSWEFIEDQARYFYYMFSKNSLYSKKGDAPVDRMLKESSKYAKDIQEDLKLKFLDSMNIVCNGYGRDLAKNGFDLKDKEMRDLIRGTGENFLFTLLFIKSLEARNVLNTNIPTYENEYSLSYVINSIDPKVSHVDPEGGDKFIEAKLKKDVFTKEHGFKTEFSFRGFELYERVLKLIDVVEKGKFGFSIKQFTNSIFSKEEKGILKKHKVNNRDMTHIFFNLGFATRKGIKKVDEKYAQIPYDYFAPRELGSIYESFLEFQLEYAEKPTFFNTKKKQWQDIEGSVDSFCAKNKINTEKVIKKKSLYFRPDNKDRKMTGSYYTPDYIVRYIVENTIGPLCDERDSKGILDLKVCDPAMGSAHFLVDALVYITNRYREKLIEEQCLNENYPTSINKVLHNCIYGVDINPRAVKLAKMSLWLSTSYKALRLEELEDQILNDNSLKNGFSIVKDGLDAIIGNPPYARIQTLNKSNETLLDEYKDSFISAKCGNFDLYVLFYEQGYNLLNNNGRLGFITPNTYLMSEFGRGLRKFILSEKCLERIIDFKQQQIFSDASTYSCITFLKKSKNKKIKVFELNSSEVDKNKFERFKSSIESTDFFDNFMINYPSGDDKWSLGGGDKGAIIESISNKKRTLGDYVEKIYQGIATSADKVFVMDYVGENKKFFKLKSCLDGKVYEIEKGVCKKFLFGKDISRFSKITKKRYSIYPYEKSNGKYALVSLNKMKKSFPKALSYLLQHKTELEKREKGKYKGDSFYQFSRPQNLDEYENIKLMMRNFSYRSQVTIDLEKENFFTTNIYGINFINKDKNFNYFMLAILNSNITWFFVKNTGAGLRGGYYQYKTKYVSPVPVVDFEEANLKNKKTVDEILRNTKEILKKGGEKSLEMKNDKLIYKLYKLTKEEIEIIEKDTSYDDFLKEGF